jgi:flagellar protein FlaG
MIDSNSLNKVSEIQISSNTVSGQVPLKQENKTSGSEVAESKTIAFEKPPESNLQTNKDELIEEVKANLEKLNQFLPIKSTNLVFEFDEAGDPPIIKVYDRESEEVIREIPTEEFREVAKALDEFADKLTNKGLLFNSTV